MDQLQCNGKRCAEYCDHQMVLQYQVGILLCRSSHYHTHAHYADTTVSQRSCYSTNPNNRVIYLRVRIHLDCQMKEENCLGLVGRCTPYNLNKCIEVVLRMDIYRTRSDARRRQPAPCCRAARANPSCGLTRNRNLRIALRQTA